MKISDYKGEDALDLLAELIDPSAEIFGDKEIAKFFKQGGNMEILPMAKLVIKKHKKAVIEILAAIDGMEPDEYAKTINVFSLPVKLLDLLNDPEMIKFFSSQAQMADERSCGPAMEIIGETEKK